MREVECYHKDGDVCSEETWQCKRCGEVFCIYHGHVTSKGTNVECVGCECQRNGKEGRNSEYNRMKPTEYAAMWGGDPVYDHFPNEKGDGYHFYNFSVAADLEQTEQVEFYRKFIPAIERTIAGVKLKPKSHKPCDVPDLEKLLAYVKRQLTLVDYDSYLELTKDIPDDSPKETE